MGNQRGNRTVNDLFIGAEHLNIEGPSVKHPSLINYYANINPTKDSEDPIELVGIDIETDADTGEMQLLGFFQKHDDAVDYEGNYFYYDDTDTHFESLLSWIKRACDKRFHFAHWNRLDPFQMLRLFLVHYDTNKQEEEINLAMSRFGKESGEFNKKTGEWDVEPIVWVSNGFFEFGIKNAIRSSIQFYYRGVGDERIKTCWAYDIAGFYMNGIEKEADYNKHPDTGRFKWYHKVGQEFHIVDWQRYKTDTEFAKNVRLSNELDARGAMALGVHIQKDFKGAFGSYARSLVSTGSFARSALTINIKKGIENENPTYTEEQVNERAYDEVSSIGIKRYIDEWTDKYGQDIVKDLYALSTESYSGGYIDAIHYGYTKEGYYADIASAYPATIVNLLDLRDAEIIEGSGEPPTPENGYIFIRGTVNIPNHVNYHSITIRSPMNATSNIRPVGRFRASYSWDEREFARQQGAKFFNEKWYYIKTKGKLSALAKATKEFIDLRTKLKAEGNTSEYMAKIAVNSIYGITFECVDIHAQDEKGIHRIGYRAGEFFNPIYASIITARARLTLAKACLEIEKNGGKPIVLMTDSVTWKGTKEMLPKVLDLPFGKSGVLKKKTLGYFEEPEYVKDIVCLGSGRYGFKQYNKKTDKWFIESKRRGLNIADLYDEKGIVIDMQFSWHELLEQMKKQKSIEIDVGVKTLISPAMANTRHEYTHNDLGRIINDKRTIQAVVGKSKRVFDDAWEDPFILSTTLVETKPYIIEDSMFGIEGIYDGTLPHLREMMMTKDLRTRKERKREVDRKRYKRYYKINSKEMNEDALAKYDYADTYGYDTEMKKKMSRWSWDRIYDYIKSGGVSSNVND